VARDAYRATFGSSASWYDHRFTPSSRAFFRLLFCAEMWQYLIGNNTTEGAYPTFVLRTAADAISDL
jgi:hypothetical protein